jgi:hypothetical protein
VPRWSKRRRRGETSGRPLLGMPGNPRALRPFLDPGAVLFRVFADFGAIGAAVRAAIGCTFSTSSDRPEGSRLYLPTTLSHSVMFVVCVNHLVVPLDVVVVVVISSLSLSFVQPSSMHNNI